MTSAMKRQNGGLTVTVSDGSRNVLEVIVHETSEKIILEGKEYSKFRIIKPQGLGNEEIFHRPERGYEALLSIVFTTLAESTRRKKD